MMEEEEEERCSNGHENAYCDIVDENGAHYVCPECGFEWNDKSYEIDLDDDDEME